MYLSFLVAFNAVVAASATVYKYSTKGFGASVSDWFYTSSSSIFISVYGSIYTDKSGKGRPVKSNYASVYYDEFDFVSAEYLVGYGEAATFDGNFQSSGATGPITVDLYRYVCDPDFWCTYEPTGTTLTITTEWIAADSTVIREHSSYTTRSKDFMIRSRSNGSTRAANALITVVRDNGDTSIFESAWGRMTLANSGEFYMERGL